MRYWDRIASFFGIAFGIVIIIYSLKIDLGEMHNPGPGFMPLFTGIVITVLCIVYSVRSIWTKDELYMKEESPWPRENRRILIGVMGALFLYVFLLPILGYIIATFLLVFFLLWVIEPKRWFITIIQAALFVLGVHVIFAKWLMIQFPKGLLQ